MSVASAERTGGPAGPPTTSVEPALGKPAEDDVRQRPAHGVAHHLGQQRPRRPDQGAGDHQDQVVQGETVGRDGQAGQRVEQRDQHRRVGPADRQADAGAEAQGHQTQEQKADQVRVGDRPRPQPDDGERRRRR